MQFHQVAQITSWRVISPLELKCKTMAEQALAIQSKLGAKPSSDANGSSEICAICQDDLITPKLNKMKLEDAIKLQQELI